MNVIVVAFALVAVAVAAPPVSNENAKIVRSDFNPRPDGGYGFGFETDNGIKRTETGELKSTVDEDKNTHEVVVVRGVFSYIDPEGNAQEIEYVADENGYQASGPSIPKLLARR